MAYTPMLQSQALQCPSCGKTVFGGLKKCPHCGAWITNRLSEQKLLALALTLLVIGLIYLPLAAIYSELKPTEISSLTEIDNFQYIKIVGRVTDAPTFFPEKYDPSAGLMKFYVSDGTDEIIVKAYYDTTKRLIQERKIPAVGDRVEVEGIVHVSEMYMSLKLSNPERLRIGVRTYNQMSVQSIATAPYDAALEYSFVQLNGTVDAPINYTTGLAFDVVADGYRVAVFVPQSVSLLTGSIDRQKLQATANVTVKGALKWYEPRKCWEVIPSETRDIQITAPWHVETPEIVVLRELQTNFTRYNNTLVRVSNATVSWTKYTNLFGITDASTTIPLDVYIEKGANVVAVSIGQRVEVQGIVFLYKTKWELKVRNNPNDYVKLLS